MGKHDDGKIHASYVPNFNVMETNGAAMMMRIMTDGTVSIWAHPGTDPAAIKRVFIELAQMDFGGVKHEGGE